MTCNSIPKYLPKTNENFSEYNSTFIQNNQRLKITGKWTNCGIYIQWDTIQNKTISVLSSKKVKTKVPK